MSETFRLPATRAHPSRRGQALFLLLVLMAVSCASTPQGKAYQTIASCNLAVQSAARTFGVLYQSHKAENPALWGDRYDKAQAAYNSYEKIRDAAVDAAKANGETTLILASINEAMNQYLALMATFGVK